MRILILSLLAVSAWGQDYDIVIRGGRVLDPESNLDAVRDVGIRGGVIRAVSEKPLTGRRVLDAKGHIVAPGFIDLHSHGQDEESYRAKAMDGVTTALEMEVGVGDITAWYAEREGKALVNFGATIGHIPIRMRHFRDSGTFLPADHGANRRASDEDITEIKRLIERGLQLGAPGVGMGLMYTPGGTAIEYLEVFRVAARFRVPVYAHVNSGVEGLNEAIGYAAITGAPLHVVHLNSSGGKRNTPQFLRIVEEARTRGLDVTTECYPYTAGQTLIESAVFSDGFRERLGIQYSDLMWVQTGERLTEESFARYRKMGGSVISFTNSEEMVELAVASRYTMIASDGILRNGLGHPRSAGTYARVLGRYARERKALGLMDAIRKMSYLPAQRLEARVPSMRNRGRIRVGAEADIAVFDSERVIDHSTYQKPGQYSEGFRYVLVGGVAVVSEGKLQESTLPGKGIRAPAK
jgi:N-acyl-D-aspartate/D-glutamate deacylase